MLVKKNKRKDVVDDVIGILVMMKLRIGACLKVGRSSLDGTRLLQELEQFDFHLARSFSKMILTLQGHPFMSPFLRVFNCGHIEFA